MTSWLKELDKQVKTTEDKEAYGASIYGMEKKQFPVYALYYKPAAARTWMYRRCSTAIPCFMMCWTTPKRTSLMSF